MSSPAPLARYAGLAIAAAILTIGVKTLAYRMTGSVGLLADALESGVNLLAAVTAFLSLRYAARPADRDHAYGHQKIEYFSSGLEGVLIVAAGLGTAWEAAGRLWAPQPLQQIGLGSLVATAAALVNLAVGALLIRVGRREQSVILEADGQHLLTDVWTTAAVLIGLALVEVTAIPAFDALLAIAVGLHITRTGVGLIRRAFDGLMDHALPRAEQAEFRAAIRAALPPGADFHLLRTRQAGQRKFLDFHLLLDGELTVRQAHRLAHDLEKMLRQGRPNVEVSIHVEPIDERTSWEAAALKALGEPPEPPPLPAVKPPIDD